MEGAAPSAPWFSAQAWTLLIGMRRGFAPQKSDDTEVVPPIYYERGAGAPIENLEGDAPSAPIFPARQRGFVGRNEAGLRPARVGRHGGRPSNIPRTRRGSAYRKPGGRCSVSAHFSRAPARPCRTEWGGASPRISRTTQPRRWGAPRKRLEEGPQGMRSGRRAWQRSSLQYTTNAARERLSKTWRALLRRRPFFPRDSVALSAGWGRGFAPHKSDDTALVPPRPPLPPVCQLSGSASKHGIPSASSSF